jgi:photosystem II stability/assembly factor-like uncharacterized protein/esterase/lipase
VHQNSEMKLNLLSIFIFLFSISNAQSLKRNYYNGAALQAINDSISKKYNYKESNGLLVLKIIPNGSAANCGVKENDIVCSVNEINIQKIADLKSGKLATLKENEPIVYKVWRNNKSITLKGKTSARPKENKTGLTYQYSEFNYKNGRIRSLVSKPAIANQKLPAILFIQGYTCTPNVDLDEKHPYRQLTDGLSAAGFAVMRIEKPGIGDNENTPPCEQIDIHEEAEAFENALLTLKKMPEIDTNNIFIWGHSMGGIIAPMLTSKNTWVKGAVVYGTTDKIWGEYILEMTRIQSNGFGMEPTEVENTARKIRKALYEIYTQKKSPTQFVKENPDYSQFMTENFGWQEGSDLLFTRSAAFNQTLDALNPIDLWSKTSAKVLAFYGEADIEALNPEGAKSIVNTINHYHPENGTYYFLKQTDHAFAKVGNIEDGYRTKADPNYSKIMVENFNPEVIYVSVDWLKNVIENKSKTEFIWQKTNSEAYKGKQDDVFFINENTGWYGNGKGKLYHTKNAGQNWELVNEKPGTFIRCLAFTDSLHGFIGNVGTDYFPNVTDTTAMYETFDAGKTWKAVTNISGPNPKGLCAIDIYKNIKINAGNPATENIIRAAGRVGSPAFLMTSYNNGKSWKSENMEKYCAAIFDIHFISADTGFICAASDADVEKCNAVILKTTDAGKSWKKVYQSARPFELTWKCSFPTHKIGYVTLQNYNPDSTVSERFVLKTQDAGETWSEIPLTNNHKVREFGVGFIDANTGFVGSTAGGFQTTNGGLTWQKADFGMYTNKFRILTSSKTVYGIGDAVYKMNW